MALGEVVKGSELEHWYANDLLVRFRGRIQSLDEAAASEWGKLCARLELSGLRMPAVDSQIAAVCLLRGAQLVTRNESDFTSSGVNTVNPWT